MNRTFIKIIMYLKSSWDNSAIIYNTKTDTHDLVELNYPEFCYNPESYMYFELYQLKNAIRNNYIIELI